MRNPLRVFEGNAKPYEPFWRLVDAAESDSGEPEMEFYGYISEYSWFDDDITPKKFKNDLNRLGNGGPVTIQINSGGGEVFAASVIRSIIVDYPGRVTSRIDGLCASAATFVALAANIVRMQDTAYFMIHDPSTIAWGTLEELKKTVDFLKEIKSGLVDAYQGKTKLDPEKLSRMMTDETWMTAKEARELGFIDEVISAPGKQNGGNQEGKAANIAAITNAISTYQHVPEALRALLGEAGQPVNQPAAVEPEEPESAGANPKALARLRAESKLYMKER